MGQPAEKEQPLMLAVHLCQAEVSAMASEAKKAGVQPADAAKTSKSEQEKIDRAAMEMAEKADQDTIEHEEDDPEDQEFTKL
jgi:hypothetical protein